MKKIFCTIQFLWLLPVISFAQGKTESGPAKTKDTVAVRFDHSCRGGYNFSVSILKQKDGGLIYVNERSISGRTIESPASVAYSPAKKVPPRAKMPNPKPKQPETTDALTESRMKPYIYTEDGFDAGNFLTWMLNLYPDLADDCAKYLAFRTGEGVLKAQKTALALASAPEPKKPQVKKRLIEEGKIALVPSLASEMTAYYDPKRKYHTEVIPMIFRVYGDFDPDGNLLLLENRDSTLRNLPTMDTLSITRDSWNMALANNGLLRIPVSFRTVNVKDTLMEPDTGYLSIAGQKNSNAGLKTIILKEGIYKRDMAYWMDIGSNFDLLDAKNFKPNNLYGAIIAFEKDRLIFKNPFNGKPVRVSFTGGVYESKSSSSNASSDSGLVYRDGRSYIKGPNGFPFYRDTGSVNVSTTVTSVGLFFSPHVLLNGIPTKVNGFHIYFSIYGEMLWQRVNTSYDYSKTSMDTVLYEPNLNSVYRHNFKERTVGYDFRSHYLGMGFPIYLKSDAYTFYLNSVFGWTSQKFVFLQSGPNAGPLKAKDYKINNTTELNPLMGFGTPQRNWNTFYNIQFRLTSEKFGVSFTGEVRGFFLHQSQPIISLSISKKIDVGKLIGDVLGNN